MEVSEYYKNTYVVYDDSRCLAEPEPEPEPEPASAGRRRTQATEEVVCSSAGGGLRCGTRRVLQDGDDGQIPQTLWNETGRIGMSLPVNIEDIPPDSMERASFVRSLLAELNRIQDQEFAAQVFQRTNDAKPTCGDYDMDGDGVAEYEYITREEAQTNAAAICLEGDRLLGAGSYWIAAVGERGGPGIRGTSYGCFFAEDACLANGDDMCGDSTEGFSVCKLRPATAQNPDLPGPAERFEVVEIYDPGQVEDLEGVAEGDGPALGATIMVIVDVAVADTEAEPIPGFIVDNVVATLTQSSAEGNTEGMRWLPQATQIERLYITPEPEPLPAPEPDPDFTITRTDVVIDVGTPPANWNETLAQLAGGLGLVPECSPGLAAACVEKYTFGLSSISLTVLEPAEDEEKYTVETFRTQVSTSFPGFNVTQAAQRFVYVDTSGPEIALFGANPLRIDQYTKFTEPGVSAFDNMDGDVTADLIVTGAVNMEVAGEYTITYAVYDKTGNLGQTTRTVVVIDPYAYRRGAARADVSSEVQGQITLDMDFDACCTEGSPERRAFERLFISSMAATLGIASSRISISSIVSGSVVVTFVILPDADGAPISTETIQSIGAGLGVGSTVLPVAATGAIVLSAPCDFLRTVVEEGFLIATGRDGRRYARATRPTKTWEWPYVIPESYYTSNLRQNRTYMVKVRGINAVGPGDWTDVFEFVTPAGKDVLEGQHVFGCQDPKAFNYNARATFGDGSCVFEMPITKRPCFATYEAACADADISTVSSAVDQATCEGQAPAGECVYTAVSVIGGEVVQQESCAAASIAACEAVPQDANQQLCEAAGACTWDPRLSQATVSGWDGDDGSVFVVGGTRGDFAGRTAAVHQDQDAYVYPLQSLSSTTQGPFTEFPVVPDNGTESGRDDYTDYPTYQNPTAGGGPGEGIEGLQQLGREARQRGDYYTDAETAQHGPWEAWAGHPGNSSHTVHSTGPPETIVDGGNIHSVFATAHQESTTNYGTANYGDQVGPGPEKWNTAGDALSGQQAFQLAAQLRAETIQQQMRDTRSDDAYRLVHGEPWGHRPGYGGKLGGSDPDLDLGAPWASGTTTHPTGIPRRLRDPEYRMYHGLAVRNLNTPWHHNMTVQDIAAYREMDVNAVRLGFQWDPDEPDWDKLGRRYMTFRACVEALNATALNTSWVKGYENVSTHLDRIVGPDYHQGPIGYGDIADTGLDPTYIPPGSEGRVNDDKLVHGLIGDHPGIFGGEHNPSVGQGHGPTTYYERWGGGPLPEPEPEPDAGGFSFVPVSTSTDRVMPIAHGLLNVFTSCDESMVTVHIFVDDWGEDIMWQVDGGSVYGPYANRRAHYYEALYLTAGEHNFSYVDRRGNGWCSPGWDRTGPDGVPLQSGCGYWDVADDTGRVLSGGPIAGLVHGRGGQSPFIVPSRCATGTQVGDGSRPGHRVSSAWNITEYNHLMEYCQERVYINCSLTPEHCTFYINATDGTWIKAPTAHYGWCGCTGEPDDGGSYNDCVAGVAPDFVNMCADKFTEVACGAVPECTWTIDQPLGAEELDSQTPGVPVNFLLNDADVAGFDFSKIQEPMQGPEFTNRPYHDRAVPYTGDESPMYDPQFGAIPHTYDEMGAEQNHRMDPLMPTSVIPPGDDPDLAPTSHGARTDPRSAFVSNHHDGPAFWQRPLIHYENAGIWPGSRSGTSVEYEPGSYYQTGLGHHGSVLGVDGSFTVGAQVTAAEHSVGGTDRTGLRRLEAASKLRRHEDSDELELTDEQVARMEAEEERMRLMDSQEKWRMQLAILQKQLDHNFAAGQRFARRRMQFRETIRYIPDSVFDGQVWPTEPGYKPKATHYPPNPGFTDEEIVGLKNPDSEIIPDSLRANEENAGFYEVPETWHGVSEGVATPQTTTNPWWLDEWASGGRPSIDLPRDLTMEEMLIQQRDTNFFGQDGVYGLYQPGASADDSCDWAKDNSCDEPTTLTEGIFVPESMPCLPGTDATDCRYALMHDIQQEPGSQGQPRPASGDQYDGGVAAHWLGPWPVDGTGYDSDRVTGYPDREYVDTSQNSEYNDRLDATTGIMFDAITGPQREAEKAISAYMDQLYLRDMAFEDMMEARRELERLRLFKEAQARAEARARSQAEDLAKLRGHGIRRHLWDWIRDEDVGPDGDLADPLFCHGLSYEQCQYKIHRQDFIAIEGTMVNMTDYLFANNLTGNYSNYVYQPQDMYVAQQSANSAIDYGAYCAGTCPSGVCNDGAGGDCIKELTVYVGDTVHFEWQFWDNVHVAYYYEAIDEECPANLRTPMCPIGNPNCHPNYWDSGDQDGDPSNDPDRIMFSSMEKEFPMGDTSMMGTYCIGSRGNSAASVAFTLRVDLHPCDSSLVGRGSPCDPPAPDPLCNATLDKSTHRKWRTLTGLQQRKLEYIWMQNFTKWDGREVIDDGSHDGKYTGYHNAMPNGGVAVSDFSTGIFTGTTIKKPGYVYNATRVPPVYVNYTVIPGYLNLTTNEWHEEEYVNGTWLNETWVCKDEVTLIPDRQPCWVGYFKRASNTGIHTGHASGDSFACVEPSNVYDTVAPYYYDQLSQWKDEQLMFPPIVWELVETLEARGVKVILDAKTGMEAEDDPYPLCGYGVQDGYQSFSDIYACFVPSNDPGNNRRRFSPGDWNRENWGYEKRFAPGDPAYNRARRYPVDSELESDYYRRSASDFHDSREPLTVRRRRANPKTRPYGYPSYVRQQQVQSYHDDLERVPPLYIPGSANLQSAEALLGRPEGPREGTPEHHEIITGGDYVNPQETYGSGYDHESYADEYPYATDYGAMLGKDERRRP